MILGASAITALYTVFRTSVLGRLRDLQYIFAVIYETLCIGIKVLKGCILKCGPGSDPQGNKYELGSCPRNNYSLFGVYGSVSIHEKMGIRNRPLRKLRILATLQGKYRNISDILGKPLLNFEFTYWRRLGRGTKVISSRQQISYILPVFRIGFYPSRKMRIRSDLVLELNVPNHLDLPCFNFKHSVHTCR